LIKKETKKSSAVASSYNFLSFIPYNCQTHYVQTVSVA